jgi:large subunit ribosomal protein L4
MAATDLPAELFDKPTNVPLIHQVVTAQLAAARQGTHKTKNRGEVSGSGVKPFKQKGTGRSRQGSVRAPEHRGGGVVHGPTPRNYAQRTPKKMIAAALLGALSDRARAGRVHVLESLVPGDVPSTKQAQAALAELRGGKRQLLVVGRDETLAVKSVRNLKTVDYLAVDQLNAYDVLLADDVVFTRAALDAFVAAKSASTEEVSA